ncbi:MAG: hypothetical protein IAE95_10840 [Chitinophagaceae bacterium]|nr:hypothetical protein [Chitinophagaceae bacterium]
MKNTFVLKTVLFVCGLLYAGFTQAQYVYHSSGTFVYDEVGMAIGLQTTVKSTTTLVFNNRFSISGIYSLSFKNATTLPEVSADKVSLLALPGDLPQQVTQNIGIMFGQVVPSHNKKVRTMIRGGISLGVVSKPVDITSATSDFQYAEGDEVSTFTMNGNGYRYAMLSQNANGIILNPTTEFLVSKYFGVSTGIYAHINKVSSTFGLDVNILLGKCRRTVVVFL